MENNFYGLVKFHLQERAWLLLYNKRQINGIPEIK
jgi:hypothetical protein